MTEFMTDQLALDPDRVEYAVDQSDFDGDEDLIREATLRLLDDVIDEDGPIECPHADCDRTFPTHRKLRGHLGSSEHALDVPEGDYWCGYCGYGPTSWRGINAHHGSSNHDGDPVRLDQEPDEGQLIAPDDVPDHKNEEFLEELYDRHDGNYTEMCRQHDFDVTPTRVRHYLIEFGIHEPTPNGELEDGPVYRDRDWLQQRYDAAGGNVSEMHRALDVGIPYRTLLKNLKRFGVHDETDPPGRAHGTGGPEPESDEDSDDDPEGGPTDAPGRDRSHRASGPEAELGIDDSDAVDSFEDLDMPGWIDEATLFEAADMADDVDEFADTLGWTAIDQLETVVEVLDLPVSPSTVDGDGPGPVEANPPASDASDGSVTDSGPGMAYVLEKATWPPSSGTYHVDDDCWTLRRSDSERDVLVLPWSVDDLEDDKDWSICGHCSRTGTDGDGVGNDTVPDPASERSSDSDAAPADGDGHEVDPDQDPASERAPDGDPSSADSSTGSDVDRHVDDDGEQSDPSPPIDWDFDPGFTTVAEQQEVGSDRLVRDSTCSRCGEPHDGDGVCPRCSDGVVDELVTDGGQEWLQEGGSR